MGLSRLQAALEEIASPIDLVPELPLAHVTTARWLDSILAVAGIEPRTCSVFNRKLLYFSYGGVFYRSSKLQTENVTELPIAMLFSPEVLDVASELFPFDSGAMAQKLFGERWWKAMRPFEDRFSIAGDTVGSNARKLVSALYSTNAEYIRGNPVEILHYGGHPLHLLHRFLRTDMSALRIDHRQRSIEVLSTKSVALANHLIWIGLPHFKLDKTLRRLREIRRTIPEFDSYDYTRNFNPTELAARLELQAKKVIARYLT